MQKVMPVGTDCGVPRATMAAGFMAAPTHDSKTYDRTISTSGTATADMRWVRRPSCGARWRWWWRRRSTTSVVRFATVLDVGCGEATWRAPLRALAPRHRRTAAWMPASTWWQRYGRSRNIGLASFGQLEHLRFETRFDLIVCTDVLHYLKPAEIRAGLAGHRRNARGRRLSRGIHHAATTWPAIITASSRGRQPGTCASLPGSGLLPCGSHCYLGPRLERHVAALERAQLPV